MPAIRIFLSIPAGNGGLERIFGSARGMLTPQRKLKQLGTLYLKTDAGQLGLEGYPMPDEVAKHMASLNEDSEAESESECV